MREEIENLLDELSPKQLRIAYNFIKGLRK